MVSSRQRHRPREKSRGDRWSQALSATRRASARSLPIAIALVVLSATTASAQWLSLPVSVPSAPLSTLGSELAYTIDLGTLPTRPVLVVEVTPDAFHPDMILEIEINNFVGSLSGPGGGCAVPKTSVPVFGPITLEFSFIDCDPQPGAFVGEALDVLVRPLLFGSGGAPANVQVVIRGETRVPTGQLLAAVNTNLGVQQLNVYPDKDTVIYASDTGASNGAGNFLWAGKDYTFAFPLGIRRDSMRPLIAFDIVDDLPFNAIIQNAELEVAVQEVIGVGGNLSVSRVAPPATGLSWFEGNAVGAGTGFTGGTTSTSAADWLTRNGGTNAWVSPGGDALGRTLDTIFVDSLGFTRFLGLESAVQGMVDEQRDNDGFILFGPYNFFTNGDEGIRLASRELGPSLAPILFIDYVAAEPWSDGNVSTTAKSFINEGDDFRWIYDVNPTDPIADDIYTTPIGGVCTVTEPEIFSYLSIPYTYVYTGTPGFTGLDCCTWQIEAPETETLGTGQAIFFHNLDPLDPANLPPDTDGDGILDNCDNCVNIANGPQLGSCFGGPTPGAPCQNLAECGFGGTCDQSQTDNDADFQGNLCEVPEPGVAWGLATGAGMLGAIGRRRRRRSSRAGREDGRSKGAVRLTMLSTVMVLAIAMAVAPTAAAQLALPVEAEAAQLEVGNVLVYTIDLETLPTRPALVVEVTPDGAHADMALEIEFSNWTGSFGGGGFLCPELSGNEVYLSDFAVGANSLEISLFQCDPLPGPPDPWAGDRVDVTIRALTFGTGGSPALLDVSIRGETRVPTAQLLQSVEATPSTQTIALIPDKDTVLYARSPTTSNGDGQTLWAGSDYEQIGGPFIFADIWSRLNSLMSFDLVGNLPFNAEISNAELELRAIQILTGGGTVSLYETGPSATGGSWEEGNADAPGTEFLGTTGTGVAANWNFRESSSNPWATPGGDTIGPLLESLSITLTGDHTFASSALTNAVQGMVDAQEDDDGFILFGPRNTFFKLDQGVRFAGSTHFLPSNRPRLRIDYTAEPHASGTMQTNVVSFITEGDDFRWIYDLDQDDVLVTDLGGVCTALPAFPGQPNYVPYTYTYSGPSYTGLDCCTWELDSPQTGTTGTGQAIFFHNLDPLDPANLPPDTDTDGILDNCDNCVNQPNGPSLGSCVGPAGVGGPCNSDQECWALDTCQLSQEDADGDFAGDACSVPEPGFGLGLFLGASLLGPLAGRSRRRLP